MKWQCLLNRSMTVRMIDLPPTRGKASMKSSPTSDHTMVGTQWQEQPSRMQVFGLVALACRASPHVVLDHRPQPWRVEVTAQPVECALDALVAVVMHPGEHLVEERRCRRDVEPALERHQAVDQRPWRRWPSAISVRSVTSAGSVLLAWRRRSMKTNRGLETTKSAISSVSRLESASATTFVLPALYSMVKSKPRSLPTQWCYGMVARHWSRNLRL